MQTKGANILETQQKKKKTKVYDTYLPVTFSKLPSGHGKHFSLP